ncbi:hypothetical protein [Actinoplanes sp. NPDC051851]|uniref:hypothetical protein n=1 Tax=Actinoplanes sp. NPDC051851 TaxID=3154753 RepID=UPI00342FC4E2
MHRERLGRLLLAGVVLMAGCGEADGAEQAETSGPAGEWRTAGCEFSRVPQHATMGGTRMLVTPAPLGAAIGRIDQGGRQRFPESYAGVEVDQLHVRAIVYRVPSEAFDAFLRETARDVCLVVRDAAHGVEELATWHDRIVADLPHWAGAGVRIVTVGSRHDGAGVEIGTRDIDRARRELSGRYGPEAPLVFVEEGPVTPLTSMRTIESGSGD